MIGGAEERLVALLRADPVRWRILTMAEQLGLPDCWIGAGFVRAAVWDYVGGYPVCAPEADIDIIWFDAQRMAGGVDRQLEAQLRAQDPSFDWSVKNQARMHTRNGDKPYVSASDAMCYWPETATAVAARVVSGECLVAAPYGLQDLFQGVVRPTPEFVAKRRAIFDQRVGDKHWQKRWPFLRLAAG